MKFRILKKTRGYIVEVEETKWSIYGLKKQWKPFVKSTGLDCAWHHSTYEYALMNLFDEIKKQLKEN
jgi:hypothetical protein